MTNDFALITRRPTAFVVIGEEAYAFATEGTTDKVLMSCPLNNDDSIDWTGDDVVYCEVEDFPASAARDALLVAGEQTHTPPRTLAEMLPEHWRPLLDHEILAMHETDGCAVDCLRVLRLADTLLESCADLDLDQQEAVLGAAAYQCKVFYFG